jgi:type II secretory pathway pseudopilin PulG
VRTAPFRDTRGFAIIDLLFVCGIVGILCAIALPRLMQARNAAGSASAIASLRIINSAQLSFAVTCGGGFYAPDLVTLGTPPPASVQAFLQEDLGSANSIAKSGYLIQVAATPVAYSPPSCNGLALGLLSEGYRAGADALDANNPRSFATNANGTIWEDVAPMFALMPESGEPAVGSPLSR